MQDFSRDSLLSATNSIYKLCNLAALRAMELNSGMKKLVDSDPGVKVTTIALQEISEGKVKMKGIESS